MPVLQHQGMAAMAPLRLVGLFSSGTICRQHLRMWGRGRYCNVHGLVLLASFRNNSIC